MAWVWLVGLWMVLGCGRAPAGSAASDWVGTFVAARDPDARVPDITVDVWPSETVPDAWSIRISEHIANAEQPLELRADAVAATRAAVSRFAGDVWAEASSAPDVSPTRGAELADVFDLPERGIQLALYQLVSGDPVLRYVRARTQADVSAADVMLAE